MVLLQSVLEVHRNHARDAGDTITMAFEAGSYTQVHCIGAAAYTLLTSQTPPGVWGAHTAQTACRAGIFRCWGISRLAAVACMWAEDLLLFMVLLP